MPKPIEKPEFVRIAARIRDLLGAPRRRLAANESRRFCLWEVARWIPGGTAVQLDLLGARFLLHTGSPWRILDGLITVAMLTLGLRLAAVFQPIFRPALVLRFALR